MAAASDPAANLTQRRQRIGAVALAAETVAEPVRREVIAHRLPSHGWPQRALRITAIDVDTGELRQFDRCSGVDLIDAVAASCAVPAAWPPVTIADRRYMDGGVGSTINLHLAEDCAEAVVLVPAGESAPSAFGAGAATELDEFGGAALGVFADDESLAAFGPNPLDPNCRPASARAGRAQGRRVSGRGRRLPRPQVTRRFRSTVSSAADASARPTSITSAARWNSRLRQAERGTSISRSGG